MVQNLDFQPSGDRLPPQNVEAEEAILGGILLDPEAIGRVMEVLHPDAFLHQCPQAHLSGSGRAK
jgi:replicative DNA helicase